MEIGPNLLSRSFVIEEYSDESAQIRQRAGAEDNRVFLFK